MLHAKNLCDMAPVHLSLVNQAGFATEEDFGDRQLFNRRGARVAPAGQSGQSSGQSGHSGPLSVITH
jgi:hypothetical protein